MFSCLLKYHSIFVNNEASAGRLLSQGFGAKDLSPLVKESTSKNLKNELHVADSKDFTSLLLMDEEAYYLADRGFIQIVDTDGNDVSLNTIWNIFYCKNNEFPSLFKVYSHFRDLGYIVRSGINFGVDFTCYRLLPLLCHSEFCIVVMDMVKPSSDIFSWRNFSTLSRVMPDVSKLLLLCYVVQQDSWTGCSTQHMGGDETDRNQAVLARVFGCPRENIELASPQCLSNLMVKVISSCVRRSQGSDDRHLSIRNIQARYRRKSILGKPRPTKPITVKLLKCRRDPLTTRLKGNSKHKKLWERLKKSNEDEAPTAFDTTAAEEDNIENIFV